MCLNLVPELVVLRLPIHRIDRYEERKNPRPLDMPQELQPESLPFVRTFDNARDVCDNERAMVGQLNDAQVGSECSEGIVGDLRARRRDDGQQRRFPRVRLTYESNVGDQLELELESPRFPFLPRLPLARRLMCGRRKECVALAATSSLRDDRFLAVFENLHDDLTGIRITDDRPGRNRHDHITAGVAGLVRPHSMLAALRGPPVAVRIVEQRCQIAVAAHNDVSTATAITPVGAAHWYAMLAAERSASRTSRSRFDFDDHTIDEHSGLEGCRWMPLRKNAREERAISRQVLRAHEIADRVEYCRKLLGARAA